MGTTLICGRAAEEVSCERLVADWAPTPPARAAKILVTRAVFSSTAMEVEESAVKDEESADDMGAEEEDAPSLEKSESSSALDFGRASSS